MDRDRGEEASRKLTEHAARRFRTALARSRVGETDQPKLEADLKWLATRDAALTAELDRELRSRLRAWQPVFDLAAPFDRHDALFPPGTVRVDRGGLVPADARTGTLLVPALFSPGGPVRVEAEFAPGWERAAWVGLVVELPTAQAEPGVRPGGPNSAGYAFALGPPPAIPGENQSVLSKGAGPRSATAQVSRNGLVLRQQTIPLPTGALRLTAERAGDVLRFRVGDTLLEFSDLIPHAGGPGAVVGVLWPDHAPLTRLRIETLSQPPAPSPLERADQLYDSGKLADAVAVYLDAVRSSPDPLAAAEAQCKAGMALIALNRPDDAAPLLQQAMIRPGDRWPVVAACELCMLRLRQKQFEEADAVLTTVAGRFTREQIARYVPAEVRAGAQTGYADLIKVNYFQPDPAQVGRLEAALKFAELMATEELRQALTGQLMISLFLDGQTGRAAEFGRKWVAQAENVSVVGEDHWQSFFWALRWYCWQLRQLGLHDRAALELQQTAERHPDVFADWSKVTGAGTGRVRGLLAVELERARVFADAGKWEQAEERIDRYLKTLPRPVANYNFHSSAYLMKGFCRLERGDPEGARAAWAAGRFPAFLDQWPADQRPAGGVPPGRAGLLDGWVLASLSNELSDEDGKRYWAALSAALITNPVVAQFAESFAISPAVLRGAWRSPRARALARKLAFLQAPPLEHYRIPVLVLGYEKLRQDLFAGEPPADADDVLWQVMAWSVPEFFDGKLSTAQGVQFALAWKGTAGIIGWGGLARTLPAENRGPLAYVLGLRYLKLNKAGDARAVLRTALADAPKDSPLARLVAAELAKLDGPPQAAALPVAPPPRESGRG